LPEGTKIVEILQYYNISSFPTTIPGKTRQTGKQGIAGLQSNLVDWFVIDNPKSKLDFGFGLSIKFCHFNPNPKLHNYFIKKLKFHSASYSNNEAKLLFIKIFKQLIYI
jgi:hypothetical protein